MYISIGLVESGLLAQSPQLGHIVILLRFVADEIYLEEENNHDIIMQFFSKQKIKERIFLLGIIHSGESALQWQTQQSLATNKRSALSCFDKKKCVHINKRILCVCVCTLTHISFNWNKNNKRQQRTNYNKRRQQHKRRRREQHKPSHLKYA